MKTWLCWCVLLFSSCLLPAETVINGNIASTQTWTPAGSPYTIAGNITIYGGAEPVVTIEAGVTVRFNSGCSLQIGSSSPGGLIVNGTAANPVLFTANSESPTPGFWKYIRSAGSSINLVEFNYAILEYGGFEGGLFDVNGGNPQFDHCVFRHSATFGLHHTGSTSSASIQNCTFSSNLGHPLYWNANQAQLIGPGNSFSGNNPNRILLRNVTVASGATWLNPGVPFEAENSLVVRGNGATPLVLSPGCEILFPSGGTLDVGYTNSASLAGSLAASGVTFGAVNPALGWNGLDFQTYTQPSTLTGCTVRNVVSGAQGGIWVRCNNLLTIQGCVFEQINDFALYCASGAAFSLSGSTIQSCAKTIHLFARDMPALGTQNLYQGNTDNRVHCLGGPILESATWTAQAIPIFVMVDITCSTGSFPTLSIPAGTVLEFDSGVAFFIGSAISATQGAILQASGVSFRGAQAIPGYWVGVILNRYGGPHAISGCTVRDAGYGGYAGIQASCAGGSVSACTVTNCLGVGISLGDFSLWSVSETSVTSCGSYPLTLPLAAFAAISGAGNSYAGNGLNLILAGGGLISQSCVWDNPGIPLQITGNVTVNGWYNPILKINSGLVLLFASGTGMTVGNNVTAVEKGGIQASGATFSALSQSPDGWTGLMLYPYLVPGSYLRNCVFEYAGSSGNIRLNGAPLPEISGCLLRNCEYGIKASGTSVNTLITRNSFEGNGVGVYCTGGANPVVGGSTQNGNAFTGNTLYGVQNTTGTLTLNAEGNWWGSASGPYHPSANPAGTGDRVSDFVDFSPWRSSGFSNAPLNPRVEIEGANVRISWDAVPGAESYDLYHSPSAATGFSLLQGALTSPTYLHLGAASSLAGFYYIKAQNTP